MVYSSWDIVCDRLKLAILDHFLPFYTPPPKKPKNLNFEKTKKNAGDIIILPTCTKNHNHMRYASWDTEWDWLNFWSLWAIFCAFTQLLNQKIKILKNVTCIWISHHSTHVYQKSQSYDVCFQRYGVWQTPAICHVTSTHVHHKWRSYKCMAP